MRFRLCVVLFLLASVATAAARPYWIGLSFNYRTDGKTRWLQLCGVASAGPAARAGLQVGDLITHVAGKPITFRNAREVIEHFAGTGKRVKLRVVRGARTFDTFLQPVPMTEEQARIYRQNLETATPD
jgi:S1-C subfamily serine protease